MTCPHCGAALWTEQTEVNAVVWACGTIKKYGAGESYSETQSKRCHDRQRAAEIVAAENKRNRVSE